MLSLPNSAQNGQNEPGPAYPFADPGQRPGFRFKPSQPRGDDMMADGPGRRLRKNVANVRKHIDYVANCLNAVESFVQPPICTPDVPVDCVLTKFARAAMNKVKCPVYALCWTPEGKRLITGASSGEFTLWNGSAFNFETILQAHDVAIRSLKWSHNDMWMVSGDHDGFVKYWQPNMNNVHMFHAHKDEPVRSISFSPTDAKLVTGSDDGTARIWDFARSSEERVLSGHGADVRSVDWHPTKALLATGSRDSQQPVKIWDPKTGHCLSTLHDHKNAVTAVEWNKNGNWLLSSSRDHVIKLYDIRMLKEVQSFRGHKKEVTTVAWHPVHEGLFASGGGDGSIGYWQVNSEKELAMLESAHDQAVWEVRWHPLGHLLASGSNDNNTKFWARNRPGDAQDDIFGLVHATGINLAAITAASNKELGHGNAAAANDKPDPAADANNAENDEPRVSAIPGMGLDENIYEVMNRDLSVPASIATDENSAENKNGFFAKRGTIMKQPPPKKAQRQFERIWNTSKPGAGDQDGMDQFDLDEEAPLPAYNNMPPPPGQSLMGGGPHNGWNKTTSLLGGPRGLGPPPPGLGPPPPMMVGPGMPPGPLPPHDNFQAPPPPFGPNSWRNGPPPPGQGPNMIRPMFNQPPPPNCNFPPPPQNSSWRRNEPWPPNNNQRYG